MANPAQSSGLEATRIQLEGFRPGLARPELDPLSITVIAGLAQGSGLAPKPEVAETEIALAGIPSSSPMYTEAQAALPLLQAHMATVLGGGPAGIGQIASAAHAHCSTAAQLTGACDNIGSTSYGEYGQGVTNMSSMATRGLDTSFGSLTGAASLFTSAGGMFDLSSMGSFGTAGGFVTFLIANKLGNLSGIVPLLLSMGITKDKINDPLYEDQVRMAMTRINDPEALAAIQDQYGTSASCSNMGDFLSMDSFGGAPSGYTGIMSTIGSVFGDMGAMFKSPDDASTMLNSMSVPNIPNLDSSASDLGAHMSAMKGGMSSILGTGTGSGGLPTVGDFMPMATGNAEMNALLGGATSGGIQDLVASLSTSTNLFAVAGIPLGVSPSVNLQSMTGFATGGLTSMGTSDDPAAKNVLNGLVTNDQYGDAITAKMDAAKNADLQARLGGISPLRFT
jgi:hypothetical protein